MEKPAEQPQERPEPSRQPRFNSTDELLEHLEGMRATDASTVAKMPKVASSEELLTQLVSTAGGSAIGNKFSIFDQAQQFSNLISRTGRITDYARANHILSNPNLDKSNLSLFKYHVNKALDAKNNSIIPNDLELSIEAKPAHHPYLTLNHVTIKSMRDGTLIDSAQGSPKPEKDRTPEQRASDPAKPSAQRSVGEQAKPLSTDEKANSMSPTVPGTILNRYEKPKSSEAPRTIPNRYDTVKPTNPGEVRVDAPILLNQTAKPGQPAMIEAGASAQPPREEKSILVPSGTERGDKTPVQVKPSDTGTHEQSDAQSRKLETGDTYTREQNGAYTSEKLDLKDGTTVELVSGPLSRYQTLTLRTADGVWMHYNNSKDFVGFSNAKRSFVKENEFGMTDEKGKDYRFEHGQEGNKVLTIGNDDTKIVLGKHGFSSVAKYENPLPEHHLDHGQWKMHSFENEHNQIGVGDGARKSKR
jgi:hypothetical protein